MIHLQENNQLITISQLVKLSLKLTVEACKIVQQEIANNNITKFTKNDGAPVTTTDYKIQIMLNEGIRKMWPNLKIVGEQNVQNQGSISTNYQQIQSIELPPDLQFNKKYFIKDICLWIDPIDNTRGFINGNFDQVTILIGISYQQKAQIGLIGLPFKKINQHSPPIFNPSVLLGSASQKYAYQFYPQKNQWKKLKPPTPQFIQNPRIVMSISRKNIIEKMIADDLKAEKIFRGGAGYKVVMVVKKLADLFLYCQSSTNKWDICAGEALMKGLGGYFTDENGNDFTYDHNSKDYLNPDGLLCGFVNQYQQIAIQKCKKYKSKEQKQ